MRLPTTIQYIQYFDHLTFDWFSRRRHYKWLAAASRILSQSANGQLYLVFCLLMLLMGESVIAWMLLTGFTLERLSYSILKRFFRRSRPTQLISRFRSATESAEEFSFPSGHTSAAFFFAGALSFVFPVFSWLLHLWAILVGSSRVMLGVHFPTDVLVGAFLGHFFSLVAIQFFM